MMFCTVLQLILLHVLFFPQGSVLATMPECAVDLMRTLLGRYAHVYICM